MFVGSTMQLKIFFWGGGAVQYSIMFSCSPLASSITMCQENNDLALLKELESDFLWQSMLNEQLLLSW